MTQSSSNSPPRALQRGLRVLEFAAKHPDGFRFSQIQQALGLPKMTVSRLLTALRELGYLEKMPTGHYCGGIRQQALIGQEPLTHQLKRVCVEPLSACVSSLRNSGLLLQSTGTQLICLQRVLHENSIVLVPAGHIVRQIYRYPAGVFCLSAEQWESDFSTRAEEMRAQGVTRSWYERERGRFEREGFTTGHLADRNRVAAALRDTAGRVVGALLIGGTPSSLPESQLPRAGRHLAEVARECSSQLAGTRS
jgi:DNA-binding IclR family transcriptional regulator